MDDLARWLGEQLDEDERIAREAPGPAWEHRQIRGDFDESVVFEDYIAVADPERNTVVFSEVDSEVLPFALRYDPARVLREIEIKRAILALHTQSVRDGCWVCDVPGGHRLRSDACTTVRMLAVVYADRTDYQESWRP